MIFKVRCKKCYGIMNVEEALFKPNDPFLRECKACHKMNVCAFAMQLVNITQPSEEYKK